MTEEQTRYGRPLGVCVEGGGGKEGGAGWEREKVQRGGEVGWGAKEEAGELVLCEVETCGETHLSCFVFARLPTAHSEPLIPTLVALLTMYFIPFIHLSTPPWISSMDI